MASSSPLPLLFTLLFAVLLTTTSSSMADASSSFQLIADAFDLPSANAMSLSDKFSDGVDLDESEVGRRSLFWRAMRYYISYGALSANRIPCPPRSGRSYYTHNCFNARGPVHPYSRGCSAITRCRR